MIDSLSESETTAIYGYYNLDPELICIAMKTETLSNTTFNLEVEETLIQMNGKQIKLSIQSATSASTLEFAGYNLGEFRVAIIQHFFYEADIDALQLIKQAKMLAWELGYELLTTSHPSELLIKSGFQSFRQDSNEIFCSELTWNSFRKINMTNLPTMFCLQK